MKELYEKIRDAAFEFRKALSNGIMVNRHIERIKNILYNNLDGIEEALKFAADAESKLKVCEVELADAERELDEKTKELEDLKATGGKGRKKASGGVTGA